MKPYTPLTIEEHWLQQWEAEKLFVGTAAATPTPRKKFYALIAFPYPSGSGLHVGHVESKTAMDMLSRFLRMQGRDVFFPVGWDAFGLPAENYAIKTGVHPATTTKDAINNFRRQIKRLGISYDWDTEIATCHPGYYKWTQWIFIQLFKAGLAYRDKSWVNWCPQDKTVLANEQVIDGACERCGAAVVQKELEQWKFKITAYQDELLEDLAQVDWPKATKEQQINWIGKSEGVDVTWAVSDSSLTLHTFTTRLDTIFGVTFVVISPEKFTELGLLDQVKGERAADVRVYLEQASHKTEEQRRVGEKDKTGVATGITVIHPLTQEKVPLWIADYVLAGYGTGVVMGVPAHDGRDHAFASKFGLEIREVIQSPTSGKAIYSGYGELLNSGEYTGVQSEAAIAALLADHPQVFTKKTSYKLRDWLISRQRYWGAPIPMVYCETCATDGKGEQATMPGWYAVPETTLPVPLPELSDFQPTDDGKSPIEKASEEWKYTSCPGCGGKAKREVDTMDTFVDSSWYYLRYADPRNEQEFANKERLDTWLPVDTYLIGPEHIVLHLLYSRFFTKFLRDQGYLKFDEPFMKMRHQGMILGPDGKKMSKSKGNVISPDEIIEKFGADTLRVYEMFMGPLDADKAWSMASVAGVYRFLTRLYKLFQQNIERPVEVTPSELEKKLHAVIKKVTEGIPEYRYNTSIAALMELVNGWSEAINHQQGFAKQDLQLLVKILAPFTPFLAEELWSALGDTKQSVHLQDWPSFTASLLEEEQVELVVQVNGKVKDRMVVSSEQSTDTSYLESRVIQLEKITELLAGATPTKIIVVPGKLVNIVL